MLRMSRVVRSSDTKRLSSGTQIRRRCTLTCCQRFVLMFECETLCALSLRLPVMSLVAMGRATTSTCRCAPVKGGAPLREQGGGLGQLGHEGAAPRAHGGKPGQGAEGGFVEVEAAGELDLDRVDAVGGAAVVLGGEAARVRFVVADRPALGDRVGLDGVDESARRAAPSARPRDH